MKRFLILMAAAVALMFTGCQMSEEVISGGTDGVVAVTVTLSSPDALVATKGAALNECASSAKGGYSNVSLSDYDIRYKLTAYRVEDSTLSEAVSTQTITKSDYESVSFDLYLSAGYTYKFVAWADFVTSGSTEDLHYSTEDLTNIYCLDEADACLNDESRDAYFAVLEQEIESAFSLSMTLNRPFAKLRVVTNDYADADASADGVSITYYNCTRFTSLNAITGDVTGETVDGSTTYTGSLDKDTKEYSSGVDASEDYRTLAVDYLLASDEQTAIHFTVTSTTGGTEITTADVSTNVPIKRNYLTTVTGELLSDGKVGADITITITDDLLEEEENDEEESSDIQAKLVTSTSSTLNFQWTGSAWEDSEADMSMNARIQLYSDEACTDLIVAWTFSGSTATTVSGTEEIFKYCDYPAFIFGGLEPETTYYFMVTVTDSDGNSESSAVVSGTTEAFDVVEIGEDASAAAGDIILAEDFSELTIGGDFIYSHRAAGFSSPSRSSFTEQPFPTGEQPGDTYYLDDSSYEVGFFNTMKNSIAATRLDTWGVINEDGNTNKGYILERPGYLKIGASSYRAILATPELSSLSGLATVQVSFKAATYYGTGTTGDNHPAAVYTIANHSVDSYRTVSGTTTAIESFTLSEDGEWTDCSVTIPNVTPLMRLGFSTADRSVTGTTAGSNQSRCHIDEIVVTVVSYGGDATLDAPASLELTSTSSSISATWSEVDGAEGYVVEYKGSSDSDYTVLSFDDGLSYTTGTTALISGLDSATEYTVRVKTGPYIESEYVSATVYTTDVEVPTSIASADDLLTFLTYGSGSSDTHTVTADIDMTGVTVSAGVANFAGTFDGGSHTISNLTSSYPLFESTTSAAIIKDLIIDSSCSFSPANYVFGAIAEENYGTISGCVNNASFEYVYDPETLTSEAALIGGLVGVSFGPITGCYNYGAITLSSESTIRGGVAGIVAYSGSSISECYNYGAISQSATRTASKVKPYSSAAATMPACIAGIVTFGEVSDDSSITKCVNYGTITFTHSAIDGATANSNRHWVAGIVGNPAGDVTYCDNYGSINGYAKSSDGSAYSTKEYIIGVAGVVGGDYGTSSQSNANVHYCNNYGSIIAHNDAAGSNSVVGGVVSWPGVEGTDLTTTVENCSNSGSITLYGAGKTRVGGVVGGSGHIIGCTNTGDITIESTASTSVVGALQGWHTIATHRFEDNVAKCNITTKCDVDGLSGLIGNVGNYTFTAIYTGNSTNCTLTDESSTNDSTITGLIVGKFNGTKVCTFGTSDTPTKVAGSVLGTAITADNYSDYLTGTTNASDNHVVYAEYSE